MSATFLSRASLQVPSRALHRRYSAVLVWATSPTGRARQHASIQGPLRQTGESLAVQRHLDFGPQSMCGEHRCEYCRQVPAALLWETCSGVTPPPVFDRWSRPCPIPLAPGSDPRRVQPGFPGEPGGTWPRYLGTLMTSSLARLGKGPASTANRLTQGKRKSNLLPGPHHQFCDFIVLFLPARRGGHPRRRR